MKKLAVVTGGSQGIGRALLMQLAQEGFALATCARRKEPLEQLHQEITAQHPGTSLFYQQVDMAQPEEVGQFAKAVVGLATPIDMLVNNAGVFIPGEIHTEPEGVFEQTMHTNVFGVYHLTRALLPAMIERQQGHVFNVCSTASITAYANGGSYCVSKFALLGMSKVLREALKPHGIRVTSVLPGATLTASWEGTELPPERFMPPEDVASAILAAYRMSTRTVVEELILRPQLGDIV
ncbi:MAG: SDR family oxidoreductase [Tunicatimonas sp.]